MISVPRTTIYALSSGAPPAGIAVVRISGPSAAMAVRTLAGRVPPPRRATRCRLHAPDGAPIDHGLVLWFPGPGSATGEDVAELHLHGGRATIAAALAALAKLPGLVPAEPGEFTRRAVEHGRLDVTEAEGLADLLAAQTETQRRAALRLAEGGLGRLVAGWRHEVLRLAAEVEAEIEFAEEHGDRPLDPRVAQDAMRLAATLAAALAQPPAERLHDGVRVVIAGPVNAGKSSLLNALVGREAAIALPEAGTTRDLIEVPVVIAGLPLLLIDSAGLRVGEGAAERLGIARAEQAIAAADLLLWLGTPAACPPAPARLCLHAQADRPDRARSGVGADLAISVVTGQGLDALRTSIVRLARDLLPSDDRVALADRHRRLLREAHAALDGIGGEDDELIVAERLRTARSCFDRLVGSTGVEEMLDTLFARFCVGK